ncbi:PREDICTED: uncharacterized protein LOC106785509 [Polistes canadensis]|uniref:uncharacterized protein LOC106785509 n=1 Tax=Polistes canadensis TaxID=91411 RepID=UPI000718FD7E|nr:PREDICTED: uncharacterized protein LOC106785509 [Polistes canadensis]
MLHFSIVVLIIAFLVTSSYCHPIEEPTKFQLNTNKDSNIENIQKPASKLEQAQELLFRIGDAIRIARGKFVNAITLARNNIVYRIEVIYNIVLLFFFFFLFQIITANNVVSNIKEKSIFLDEGRESLESLRYPPSIFSASTTSSRETVRLENESEQSLAEKTLTLPFNDLFINLFNPTPLVDQIKEEDKYGNTGNKMAGIGRALVNGYESFSNFLNSAINVSRIN